MIFVLIYRYDSNENPTDVYLIDNSIYRIGSPIEDLSCIFYLSVEGPLRKKFLNNFLCTYYSSFNNVLAGAGQLPSFSFEQLKEEYRKKVGFGMCLALGFNPLIFAESQDLANSFATTEEEFASMAKETGKNMMKQNPIMRPMFLDLIDEMVEYGLIK